MLRPARMAKIRLFATESAVPSLIKTLHELGIVEIRRFKVKGLEEGRPLKSFDEISENLVKIRALLSLLGVSGTSERANVELKELFAQVKEIDETIGTRVRELASERAQLEEKKRALSARLAVVSKLAPLKDIQFDKIRTKRLDYVVGELPSQKVELLKSRLEKNLTDYNLILSEQKSATSIALLIYPKRSEGLETIFAEASFSPIQVPEGTTRIDDTEYKLKEELSAIDKKEREIATEICSIAKKYGKRLLDCLEVLSIEADRAEIASRFSMSKRITGIEGWIKAADLGKLESAIAPFGDSVVLQKESINEHEQPPIVLENPAYAEPFEFITKNFSLPNYREFDPTFIYFIGFPIIYGMVVGDVFYGILSLFVAQKLMKIFSKSEIMLPICKIWYLSAFPSIFFGLLFDEWGGLSHAGWLQLLAKWGIPISPTPLYHGVFSRLHDFSLLLGITLLIGLIHIAIGFLLGATHLWEHHRKHAYAKLAWLGFEIGGALAVASGFLNILSSAFLLPSLIVTGISVASLLALEGALAALELPSLVGNILSYARVAATGVAGVVLAELINKFFMPFPEAGIAAIILIPILFILHVINTFIAMFESLIQVGRLNIIEFKSKFVEGGGVLFTPFALKKK
ncbi:MAG: V-type ATPase 116kDa subunit family protein [Candidatus Bilamarchaeaceae archaeon]